MKLLLDHCVPRKLGNLFTGHQVSTCIDMQWDRLRNGILLNADAQAGFDAMITVDQNMKYQQNISTLPISVVVMCSVSNDITELSKLVPQTLAALTSLQPRQFIEVPSQIPQ